MIPYRASVKVRVRRVTPWPRYPKVPWLFFSRYAHHYPPRSLRRLARAARDNRRHRGIPYPGPHRLRFPTRF